MTESGTAPSGQAKLEQLRALSDISRALTYATSLEQVAHLTLERGAGLLDAPAAVIMLTDDEGRLQVRGTHGIEAERVARFTSPLDDELTGRLCGLFDVTEDRLIAVPLVAGGVVTGLVAVVLHDVATDADEWLLSALADQAAVALENARLGGEVRVEMEARLRASEGQLGAKDRALETLAHDIRSPLHAIDAYSELIEDGIYGAVNDSQREALGRIRMSGRHLLSLLDNVMDMARLNAGVVRVTMEEVDITEVARESVAMMTPAADARLQILQLGERAAVTVAGDAPHLRQVLVNLIGNAIKFTPDRGRITVSTGLETVDGQRWGVIRVSDTGPGIAREECAAIFEPFYRSEGTSRAAGVGLGLAISHALVSEMGGTITVESEPGAGAVFSLRLRAMGASADGS